MYFQASCTLLEGNTSFLLARGTTNLYFLEGVGPFEVKLVLRELIETKKLFTLSDVNNRIATFPIGPNDSTNRPTSIPDLKPTSHTLKQKAFQFGCLLRLLPLMIGDMVPVGDGHWEFLLELRHIGEIIFSEKWTPALVDSFEQQWAEHLYHFKELFPGVNLIPKHHFICHYGQFVLCSGPPVRSMTATKEIKGNFFKKSAHIVCNFKNICYTLANRHQFFASNALLCGSLFKDKVELFGEITTVSVDDLPIAEKIRLACSIPQNGCITCATKVVVRGQLYREGNCVIISMSEKPSFAKICHVLLNSLNYEAVFLFVILYETVCFDNHYFSYRVKNTGQFDLVALSQVRAFHPLDIYQAENDDYFVPLRHKVF